MTSASREENFYTEPSPAPLEPRRPNLFGSTVDSMGPGGWESGDEVQGSECGRQGERGGGMELVEYEGLVEYERWIEKHEAYT